MTRIKPVLWLLLGVVIGFSAVANEPPAMAQNRATLAQGGRLTSIPAGSLDGKGVSFLRDSKSGSCWLLIGGELLASAPREACD